MRWSCASDSYTTISRKKWASTQQSLCLALRVTLGCRPACKHKSDLVDEVCNVVDHVQEDLVHSSEQVAEQIAKRVDTPANCHDQAHGAEGACDSGAAASPLKISKRMKNQPNIPPAKAGHARRAPISPRYPKESIMTVPPKSFQNIAALVGLPAALRMRLNSII